MINLNNAYKVTLTTTQGRKLIQYIEAGSSDHAIRIAKNTFEAGFCKFQEGAETQKACDKTKLKDEVLRFGFKGGWNTLYLKDYDGLTIFEAVDKAKHCFGGVQEIIEITNAPCKFRPCYKSFSKMKIKTA
jgi:hypothetical protein